MEAKAHELGVGNTLFYMFPQKTFLNSSDIKKAAALTPRVDDRMVADIHSAKVGGVELAEKLFTNANITRAGLKIGAVNAETNANFGSFRRAVSEACDLNDWFNSEMVSTNAISNRLHFRAASFCMASSNGFDNWDQGISFFLPNMTFLQPAGYVHQIIDQTWQPSALKVDVPPGNWGAQMQNSNASVISAQRSADGKTLVLRFVNAVLSSDTAIAPPTTLTVHLKGSMAALNFSSATMWTLSSLDSLAANTPGQPTLIAPEKTTLPSFGDGAVLHLLANSYVVVVATSAVGASSLKTDDVKHDDDWPVRQLEPPTVLHVVRVADLSMPASGGTCSFAIYPHTACTRDPYKTLPNVTLSTCCSACSTDNQCRGFTLHQRGPEAAAGECMLALGAGVGHPAPAAGVTCGARFPLPVGPPPPPGGGNSVPLAFDCGTRRLALEFAGAVLSGRGQGGVWEALQLGPKCNDPAPPPRPRPAREQPVAGGRGSAGLAFWVSPTGDDEEAGTSAGAAWKTLPRVLAALAATPAATRPPTTVTLLPGVYPVAETLALTAAHSGASAGAPVVFRAAAGGGNVTLSGGVPLTGLRWQKVAAAAGGGAREAALEVWSAKLPERPSWRFESLFAGRQRQWRARWPNGNPETYCARDLHGGNCEGYAQVGIAVEEPAACGTACAVGGATGSGNCNIFAAESGELIAEGTLRPLGQIHDLTIATPNIGWHHRKATFSTARFFEKPGGPPAGMAPPTKDAEGGASFQIDRFDTRVTKCFWDTAVPSTLPIRQSNFSRKSWAHPELAVAHVYQTEYWGIWMFQVCRLTSSFYHLVRQF